MKTMSWTSHGSAKPRKHFLLPTRRLKRGVYYIRDNQIGSLVEAYWEKLTAEAANDL